MAAIDYEVEYNNRARVPEHAAIFERWKKDAANYRETMTARKRAELRLAYGATPRQTLDIFYADRRDAPLAMFIHGGYWRSLEPAMFSHTAAGLNARGITVAVAGYDLCPNVPIATIIDEMTAACLYLWRRFGRRIFVYGHSAGGHLAACLLATDWSSRDRSAPADLVPAASAISGVFDLTPLIGVSMNEDLRLDDKSTRAVSPLFHPAPKGKLLDVIVGAEESSEFLRQSRIIAEGWGKQGVATRFEAVDGANHFTVVDPLSDPKSAMVARLAMLSA